MLTETSFWTAYSQLLAQPNTSTKPASASRPTSRPRHSIDSLALRFYSKASWNKYAQETKIVATAESGQEKEAKLKPDPEGPAPPSLHFLEDEKGQPIEYKNIEAVRQCMKRHWLSWQRKDNLPAVWGSVDEELLTRFIDDLYSQYKFLSYCEHDWKLHKLAQMDYPPWYRTHAPKILSVQTKVKANTAAHGDQRLSTKRARSPTTHNKSSKRTRRVRSVEVMRQPASCTSASRSEDTVIASDEPQIGTAAIFT